MVRPALLCRAAAGLALAWLWATASAQANTVECGGNSVSYAEVTPRYRGKPPRGPIEVLPYSLCADLIEHRPSQLDSLQLTIDPTAAGPGLGTGAVGPRRPGSRGR